MIGVKRLRIIIRDNIEGKQLKSLFGFCFGHCDNIYLTNYYTDLVTKEEKEKADEELKKRHISYDLSNRKRFYSDYDYRKELIKCWKTEENVITYFNSLVNQDLNVFDEFQHSFMSNEIEKCIVEEMKRSFILEDIKRREKFCEDENFRKNMLKKYKTQENVIYYFNTLVKEELGIKQHSFFPKGKIEIMKSEEERLQKEYKENCNGRYASYEFIKERLNIFKEKFILVERNVTNEAKMTESFATFVEYRFEINDGMKKVLNNMEKIYDIPVLVSEIVLEDPVFCCGDKEFLSICSHEHDGILYLDEEEYKEFLGLKILHDIGEE